MGPTYVDLHHRKNNKNYKELALIEKHTFGTIVRDKGVQWSNSLGEKIVYDILVSFGFNVKNKTRVVINERTFIPDFETEYAYYEVKTRNYSTPGTSGEKILGTPLKYIDIPKVTGKPLFIVLVGYQEYEAIHMFKLFDEVSNEKKTVLDTYTNLGIYYIGASQLWSQLYNISQTYNCNN
jgi:hypothetical protein